MKPMTNEEIRVRQWAREVKRRRRIDRKITTTLLCLVTIVIVVAVFFGHNAPEPNTDPRQGPVQVNSTTLKYCDGSTLLYEYSDVKKGGLAAVAQSSECR